MGGGVGRCASSFAPADRPSGTKVAVAVDLGLASSRNTASAAGRDRPSPTPAPGYRQRRDREQSAQDTMIERHAQASGCRNPVPNPEPAASQRNAVPEDPSSGPKFSGRPERLHSTFCKRQSGEGTASFKRDIEDALEYFECEDAVASSAAAKCGTFGTFLGLDPRVAFARSGLYCREGRRTRILGGGCTCHVKTPSRSSPRPRNGIT